MPTYEYQCLSCNHKFELLQPITAKPVTKCPKCAKKVKKLISSTGGFIFKGSGFYATDYKAKSHSHKAKPASCPKANEGCSGCKGLS
ncbi:zinc ribbon domain-containing protein [bacterium]|nr:MAG: zinc ribbon domain-containing protein [bacterium]